MKKLSLSAIGCGNRSRIYLGLAAEQLDRYEIIAAADPNATRLEKTRELSNNPDFKSFRSADEFLAEDKMSDVVIIGTQDSYHYEPCKKALQKGYDVLLEKPISPYIEEVFDLQSIAERLGRKLQVCYVLRYTPFYTKAKEIVDSGALGEIVSIAAVEGVIPWHQAHSFVRGNWRRADESSPMIVAKCCHDLDIIQWLLVDAKCSSISSCGDLTYFKEENAPEGAPKFCVEGCPAADTCIYDARKYAGEHRSPWLEQVYDRVETASEEEILEWLRTSPYGRCAFRCDNDVVDHQVVSMSFDNGATASLTMTAFDNGRALEIFGTKGCLRGGRFVRSEVDEDIVVEYFDGRVERHSVADGADMHMGGDAGIVQALYDEMAGEKNVPVSSYIQSHVMAHAAEKARVENETVRLADFAREHARPRP